MAFLRVPSDRKPKRHDIVEVTLENAKGLMMGDLISALEKELERQPLKDYDFCSIGVWIFIESEGDIKHAEMEGGLSSAERLRQARDHRLKMGVLEYIWLFILFYSIVWAIQYKE